MTPNSVYYWTESQKLSQNLSGVLGLAAGRPAWDVYLLYQKGVWWDRNFPAPTFWQHLIDGILQGQPLDMDVFDARVREYLAR